MEEKNWYLYDYLVIDKTDDIIYFKDTKAIAKYYDLELPVVYNICCQCRRNYTYRHHKHEIFIQRLYNNVYSRHPDDTTFIFDRKQRLHYLNSLLYNFKIRDKNKSLM